MKRFLGKPVNDVLVGEFTEYLTLGGFPKALEYEGEDEKRTYIKSVIHEIFEKDVKHSNKIKNVSVFDAVQTYLINNFGAPTNLKNLLAYFNDVEKIPIKRETLNRYIQILVDAKILYRCSRFDLKSRRSLIREEKYYLADPGFYFAMNTDARINYGPALENVLYLYLASRGYELSVGRIGKLECDFIARRRNAYAYSRSLCRLPTEASRSASTGRSATSGMGIRATCSRLILYCRRGMASGTLTWRRLCKMAVILFEWWPDPFGGVIERVRSRRHL